MVVQALSQANGTHHVSLTCARRYLDKQRLSANKTKCGPESLGLDDPTVGSGRHQRTVRSGTDSIGFSVLCLEIPTPPTTPISLPRVYLSRMLPGAVVIRETVTDSGTPARSTVQSLAAPVLRRCFPVSPRTDRRPDISSTLHPHPSAALRSARPLLTCTSNSIASANKSSQGGRVI